MFIEPAHVAKPRGGEETRREETFTKTKERNKALCYPRKKRWNNINRVGWDGGRVDTLVFVLNLVKVRVKKGTTTRREIREPEMRESIG